tara:strand:- start:1058 stop:1264 length:207 start_codon:yes stop_codon:yes gene_type:complete
MIMTVETGVSVHELEFETWSEFVEYIDREHMGYDDMGYDGLSIKSQYDDGVTEMRYLCDDWYMLFEII